MPHADLTPDLPRIIDAFALRGVPAPLPGGEQRTFRCGDVVLRRENADEMQDAAFSAELFDAITESPHFRVPRPVRSRDGAWLVDGWSAWTYVDGREAGPDDVPGAIAALEAFHAAIADVPRPAHLSRRDLPYDRADRGAFGEHPDAQDPALAAVLDELCALRRPIALREQVIHGDANGANILIAPGAPPAIIDMAPYWRPAEFALAVSAFWMGAYQGHERIFPLFERVRELDQLLLRACIRSLLVMHEFGHDRALPQYLPSVQVVLRRLRHRL